MEIKSLASSSNGNCYMISDGKTSLLIEAGITLNKIKNKLDYKLPDHALISHSHQDHSKAVKDLLKNGIDCYMSEETAAETGVENHYRTNIIRNKEQFDIGSFMIKPLEMAHDVYCFGFLIYSTETKERLFFATDTYFIPYQIYADYIMVEANYDRKQVDACVADGSLAAAMRSRLFVSHMEINTLIDWMMKQNRKPWKHIYLMHLSSRHSDAEEFKKRVIIETGKQVTVCEE